MRRLIVALGFLTRLPVPRIAVRDADFADAIRCYPLAGLAIGALVATAGWIGAAIDPWLGALAALVTWVAVTGALHLDGLGDLADGVGAAHGDEARLLAVMADPHVGSFGLTAIALQLLAKLVLLHAAGPGLAPVLVPCLARTGPLLWARTIAPLKPVGLGAAIAGAVRTRDLAGWGALCAGMIALVPPLAAALLAIPAYGGWVRRRLGGITGDAHGAGIELVETALLLALVVAGRV